jgi:predicted  nucleic acid-binding Zn-ribbon protein
MATYSLSVVCNNCGHHFTVSQEKGKERPRTAECPACGCQKITYTLREPRCGRSNWFAENLDVFFNGRSPR